MPLRREEIQIVVPALRLRASARRKIIGATPPRREEIQIVIYALRLCASARRKFFTLRRYGSKKYKW
jgi:hypothetical protein